ncbi:thioredoxin family protein [Sulfurospirillum barnesii]|uniref:Thioredoxin n=1 Tax=Sulfurospirillum barnesii (strain ATCC 700032 / DSM 10660 / SES-3) TaxID=760154 RepID=I3XXG2_SULBS|nr:thioredoxin family protein [Sulfurospirillum barnesii]AFL68636.1 Thioredoxin [Sulfurospirillum barnesii SES-3]
MMQPLDETAVLKRLQTPSPRAFFLLFYTTQCSQCKIAHARLERVMQKSTFDVDFFTCNLDVAPKVSEHFGIRSVPVCMTFNQKGEQQRVEYALKSEAVYESMVLSINAKKGDPKSRLLGF